MKNLKNWSYKILYSLVLSLKKNWLNMIAHFFAIVGAGFTLAEIIDSVFLNPFAYDFIRKHYIFCILIAAVVSFVINKKPLKYTCFINDTDVSITLVVDDIFHQKGDIIIPTNTTFDTTMQNNFISPNSVQGQYQDRCYHNRLPDLDQKIEEGLKNEKYIELKEERATKTKAYPIGTTCKLSHGSDNAYFLAVTNIDKNGKATATMNDVVTAMSKLWRSNIIGGINTLRIPLVGSGYAGVKGASRETIIKYLISTFKMESQEKKITEKLIICIHPTDFFHKNLHWEDICDYLKFMCKFPSMESPSSNGNGAKHEESISA